MADKIKVNTSSLSHTRDTVKRQVGQIRSQIGSLYEDAAALSGMWEGDAHSAFDAALRGDIRRLEQIVKSLQGIVTYEDNAVTEYSRCEQKVSSLVAGISV